MPDDEEINALPATSLSWMAAMISKDEEEKYERDLAFVEYLASFINFEAVQRVQEARKHQRTSSDKDDEIFRQVIEWVGGRPAPEFMGDE